METGRDYSHLIKQLKSLNWDYMQIETVGSVKDYPIYSIRLTANQGEQRPVLVSAGTHGDEPAGVEAILHFLERNNTHLLETFEFLILPCINPYGYVHNTRENGEGVDINRSFEEGNTPEAVIVKKVLQGLRFDLFIEFHEDWEYSGFYLFEERRNGELIGPEIIKNVEKVGPIHRDATIDDFSASNGVLSPDVEVEDFGYQAMPLYVYNFHSDHIITCETPSRWHLEQRVAAHLAGLDTALADYLSSC